jgi:hypothetical protein
MTLPQQRKEDLNLIRLLNLLAMTPAIKSCCCYINGDNFSVHNLRAFRRR